MILYYYHIDTTEEEIAKRCNHTYKLGCYDTDMKAAIESYGLGCIIQNDSTLDDIKYWLDHNIPVIVDWFSPGLNSGLEDMPNGHSSVVVELDKEKIYLLDPEIGEKRGIPHEDFLRVWFDWKEPLISADPKNLVIRQIMVAYPKKLEEIIQQKLA